MGKYSANVNVLTEDNEEMVKKKVLGLMRDNKGAYPLRTIKEAVGDVGMRAAEILVEEGLLKKGPSVHTYNPEKDSVTLQPSYMFNLEIPSFMSNAKEEKK